MRKAWVARWRRFYAAERRDKIGWAAGAGRGLGARAAAFESTAVARRGPEPPPFGNRTGCKPPSRKPKPPRTTTEAQGTRPPDAEPSLHKRRAVVPRAPERLLPCPHT